MYIHPGEAEKRDANRKFGLEISLSHLILFVEP